MAEQINNRFSEYWETPYKCWQLAEAVSFPVIDGADQDEMNQRISRWEDRHPAPYVDDKFDSSTTREEKIMLMNSFYNNNI